MSEERAVYGFGGGGAPAVGRISCPERQVEERLAAVVRQEFASRFGRGAVPAVAAFFEAAPEGAAKIHPDGVSVVIAVSPRETLARNTGMIEMEAVASLSVPAGESPSAAALGDCAAVLIRLFARMERSRGEMLEALGTEDFRCDGLAFASGGSSHFSPATGRWIVQIRLTVTGVDRTADD